MLKLTDIRKNYPAGDGVVEALKGVSLEFRKSEFVSILGPSGCGKTTMLNIIGGLDQYTSGDLIINGKSTKDFSDRDWDSYRNHSVGFVFQSYNLIPHQTVLQNVEIALSLSGVGKAERKKRAKEALEKVGLANQLYKKPNEMSGGQMQRVAIARAIVNDPDIILADEPTGALDTETSVQVMDILKEISKDRLVVMVTHNPDIAQTYSTRIIKMLDGEITDDSSPLTAEEIAEEAQRVNALAEKTDKKTKKPSLSFATSFALSLKNLISKKGRTTLTAFAGSIGIIGIALIYAVSQGTTAYIDAVQEDTLSSYPITLEAQSMDLTSLMTAFIGSAQSNSEHENDAVYQKSMIYDFVNALSETENIENDLKSFKEYLEQERAKPVEESKLSSAVSGVQYTYDFDLLVYTQNVDGEIMKSDSQELMQNLLLEYFGMDMSAMLGMSESMGMDSSAMMGMSSSGMNLWQQMLPGDNGRPINDMLLNQYDVVAGSWPNDFNEIVLVLDENNEVDDLALYALGLKSGDEIDKILNAALNKTDIEKDTTSWSYDHILNMDFRVILNSQCYTKDEATGVYTDLRETNAGLKYLYDNGIDLTVAGIIKPKEDAVSTMLTGSIAYTSLLTEYVMEQAQNSSAVKEQLANPNVDIFTGLPFKNDSSVTDEQKVVSFDEYIASLDDAGKISAYTKIITTPSEEAVNQAVQQQVGAMTREQIEQLFTENLSEQMGMSADKVKEYLEEMSEDELKAMFSELMKESVKAELSNMAMAQHITGKTPAELLASFVAVISECTDEQKVEYYDVVLEFSETEYDLNMKELGFVDPESPSTISIYATDFENKDVIEEAINDYNSTVDELSQITYTDYVGLMMSSITTIINAITYVLIAFVAVSLIVSSIMIGVITLISVQERTKEIGILRAIGASKRNVSAMFNAETVIIGFISGAIGVIITYLLCIPINLILHSLTGINNLSAQLPIPVALVLVAISVLLTLFAGIIPSKSAAKKDPVVALRSE